MQHTIKTDWITKLYIFVLTLYIFRVYDTTWLYGISVSLLCSIVLVVISLKFFVVWRRGGLVIGTKSLFSILLLLFYSLYSGIVTHIGDNYSSIRYLTLFVSMSSIILLSKEEKLFLLGFITNAFVFVLVVSLFGWLLYLLGFNLPHSDLVYHPNGFHLYYNYYLFRIGSTAYESIFPRFQSIFLEPGQLATPCVFLFFLDTIENKILSFKNIVLLIAIVLSFSLIAYGLLLVSLVSIAWFKGARFRIPLTIIVLSSFVGFYFYFSVAEDSAVNALILERLEYDEERFFVGNNRTGKFFDKNYELFMQSNDKYFGIHDQLRSGNDWTYNASGYKKFIVHQGIVGFSIFMLYILSLYWSNRNKKTFVFLIILLTAFFIRNLLQNPMWMSIAIIGFYTLANKSKNSPNTI